MSRRKQACPSRSVKAPTSEPAPIVAQAEEEPITTPLSATIHSPSSSASEPQPQPQESHTAIVADCDNSATIPDNRDDSESPDIPPLVINTDAPSSPPPPPPSSIEVTPSLNQEIRSLDTSQAEDLPPGSSSPALDIPPESSSKVPPPLNLLSSPPPSPDRPSTPSSLNSTSSQADAANTKQKRGKKIMPVQGNDGSACYECPICGEKLKGNHEFTAHIRSHNNVAGKKPNTCTICFKELSSQSSLDRHMLVHSGERPFSCKVCGMSFTTNGNMHRHSRIHKKEEFQDAQKPLDRPKSSKPKSSSSVPLAPKPASISPTTSLIPPASSAASWHRPGVFNPDRPSPLISKPVSGVDLQKLMALGNESFPPPGALPSFFNSILVPPFVDRKRSLPVSEKDGPSNKRQKEEDEETTESGHLGFGQSVRDARTSGIVAADGRKMAAIAAMNIVKGSLETQKAAKAKGKRAELPTARGDVHQLFQKRLLSNCGPIGQHLTNAMVAPAQGKIQLLNHHELSAVSSGASSSPKSGRSPSFKCSDCEQEFNNLELLQFHKMLQHFTNEQAEQYIEQNLAPRRDQVNSRDSVGEGMETGEESMDTEEEVISGFHDLDFMDFTSRKFSLAAKALCEEKPHKSSSKFHNFKCNECPCSFPNKSALVLHLASHVSSSATTCPECRCHFTDPSQLYHHMYNHEMQEAFVMSQKNKISDETETQESIEKKDFLGIFELMATGDVKQPCNANNVMIEKLSKEQNNKYHAKVYQTFSSLKAKENADRIFDGQKDADTFQRECSSSVLTTLNQSLSPIPSTDIPRMSASAPPQLSSTLRSSEHPATLKAVGLTPSKLSDSLTSMPSALQTVNCITPNASTGDSALSSTNGHLEKDQSKEEFQCSICGSQFTSKRAFKGHIRSHLGSQKHHCTACPYSSSDKSTLTRHMRTHTGQRPYECRLCAIGFTTKANCERHIRKRHGFVAKEDMEKYVVVLELTEGKDNTPAPSTVCQYCGEDLKFLQALQHHTKTKHANSELKLFICAFCSARLPTKAEAFDHVHRNHTDCNIEMYIKVIPLTSAANYGNDFHDLDDDGISAQFLDTTSPSPASTPGLDPTPPKAHSTPVFDSGSKTVTHLLERPIDFSMKNAFLASHLSRATQQQDARSVENEHEEEEGEEDEEAPMDLSTKGRSISPASSSVSPSVSPAISLSSVQGTPSLKNTSGLSGILPCHLCKKTFTAQEALQQHLLTTHQISPSSAFTILTPSDNNNNSSSSEALATFLPMSMMSRIPLNPSLTGILQAHAASLPVVPTHPAFPAANLQIASMLAQRSLTPLLAAGMTATTPAATKESRTSTPSTPSTTTNSSGSESSCDLASVHKIIESATNQNLQVFLKPQAVTSASEDSEPLVTPGDSADEDSDQSLDKLYTQSLNGTIPMKLGIQEAKAPSLLVPDVVDDDEEEEDDNEEEEEAGQESGVKESRASTSETQNENKSDMNGSNSPKGKPSSPNAQSGKKPNPLGKKKRNSYADSPHKMQCPHCPRTFPWISSLNRHMLTHTGQKPYICKICNVNFSTKSNRERHLTRKHGVDNLDPASRQTMDRPYKCHLCVFSSFSTESNLLKHYKERHPGVSPPERYLRGSAKEDGFLGDMDEMASSNMEGWSENNSVDDDDAEEAIPTTIKAGVKSLVENVVTSLIKNETKPSPSPSKETTPTETTHSSIVDDNEEDSNDNELPSNNEVPLTPPSMSGSADRHINPERDNYNVDKITFCWYCGEQFTSRKLLVRHLKEHNIDLPFKCYLCDASFDSRCECLTHQEKSHPSDWAVLKDKNGVDSIEDYSERLDRIVERNCRTGQFVEEGEEGEGGAQTTAATTTTTTTATAGEDGQSESVASDYLQRKVYCSLCSKRFWSLQDLRRHMRSHTGERPFACDKCNKRFTLKHSMMRHRRKHVSSTNGGSPAAFSDDEDDVQLSEASGKAPATHMGSGLKALRQHLAAASGLKTAAAANIPTTVMENNNNLLSDDKDNNEDNMGDDILHNLLGVESETIDQIIDKKDSAATLLGVKNDVVV